MGCFEECLGAVKKSVYGGGRGVGNWVVEHTTWSASLATRGVVEMERHWGRITLGAGLLRHCPSFGMIFEAMMAIVSKLRATGRERHQHQRLMSR